jgi:aryl-alcohol dehydrogenase-like predicted oxidoreductase
MRAEASALAVLVGEALTRGVTLFDTARAYGESERVLGEVLRGHHEARVVTKGGMLREGNAWQPDGRARTLLSDCETSLRALGGVPIHTYLVHAPDQRVSWETTVRALARIAEQKLAKHVGVCNVTRKQLDEALELAPIDVVQVDVGTAVRGGVAARCIERGVAVMIHSPLGGPKRASRLGRDERIAAVARRHGVTPHAAMLAMLLDLHPSIVVIPGATRPETLRDCLRALEVRLGESDRLHPAEAAKPSDAEVVLLMGIQGAGKSTLAATYVERGYERLNRDERGGTLRGLHEGLGQRLAAGSKRLVLDNTYLTRAMRYDAIAAAKSHGASVRGVWIETAAADAQVNVILRMLAAHGRLLTPAEMQRSRDPSGLPPNALLRALRELERPEMGEGFTSLDIVPFTRRAPTGSRTVRFVAHDAHPVDGDVTFAWQAEAMLVCPHEGGPPRCWCRPPYPGLLLEYAARHDVDLTRSEVVGTSPAHERMAAAVGARYTRSVR